jgi:phenylacetate-CoA ligase
MSSPYPRHVDEARHFGLLSEQGREFLRRLQEHPHAPRFNLRCGDRLTAAGLERVRAYEAQLRAAPPVWRPGELPPWVREFAAFCLREAPFYRWRGGSAEDFLDLPTTTRGHLAAQPWAFVPDSQPLDELVVYYTAGTTGHPLTILSHPETVACKLPLLRRALARFGVTLEGGGSRVALVQLCFQKQTVTFAAVSSFLDEAGMPKINLAPSEWRDPDDRSRFLDSCNPEIYTGTPIAFAELARLPLTRRPKALVSTALTVLPGLREQLETHFCCPVVDIYSLNESGPVAVATPAGRRVLPHDLYVEVLAADGSPCPPGERGEITLTGGRNPFLPLLRYRTGDYGALAFDDEGPLLVGLEGRPPTVFWARDGRAINNIDVSSVLRPFALSQFALHQEGDGALRMRMRGNVSPEDVRRTLLELFGPDQPLRIEPLDNTADEKIIQYTSDYQQLGG